MTISGQKTQKSYRSQHIALLLYCVRVEVLKLIRVPSFTIPVLVFPMMFFTMFGLPHVEKTLGGIQAGAYLMGSYGAYAVMSVGMFSFGVSIAVERALSWNRLLRASPLEPVIYFLAKMIMSLLFGLLTLALLFIFCVLVGGVRLSEVLALQMAAALVTGMVPFAALGLSIGYTFGPNSAAGVANLIFLPLSFASGLFVPFELLPKTVQEIAPLLPSYHTAQLAWGVLGAGDGTGASVHLIWITSYTAVFLTIAVFAYRRDERMAFG